MKGSLSLTGSDTIKIDERILNDLADGDAVVITYPNDLAAVKTGKNGNTIYAFNETGRNVEVSLRVLLGSSDDKYLNSRMNSMKNDFAAFTLLTGEFVKRVGDGTGSVNNTTYIMSGGIFKKQIEAKYSAEGDVSQSVAVYTLSYGNGDKTIA